MENKYNEVPNIISGKDLDYLSDMFAWNYGALKATNSSINSAQDSEIKEILKKACTLFDDNMKLVLNILGGNYE